MARRFFQKLSRSITKLKHAILGSASFAVLPRFQEGMNLGEFINKIYIIAIAVVGAAVLFQFTIAGFTYLLAAGNAAEVGRAQEKMKNAILGAILLLSAYLILNVINPDLTKTNLFNLEDIRNQLPKYDPRCDIDPANCEPVSNDPQAQKLRRGGVEVAQLDVSKMTDGTILKLLNLKANCASSANIGTGTCSVKMEAYENKAGGELVGLAKDSMLTNYILGNFSHNGSGVPTAAG